MNINENYVSARVEGSLLAGEGYATYVKETGQWFSVSGTEVRWQVSRADKIQLLEEALRTDLKAVKGGKK